MARTEELRLMARVARMYYLDDLKQSVIAERLCISQASISRLLRRAREESIVRISVDAPRGTFPELEERLCQRFGLAEAIVADCDDASEEGLLRRIGEAAAHYVETTLQPGEVIGISSWSESLLRMVENIHPTKRIAADSVVQILGGMGNPAVQGHATALTGRLARLIDAVPRLLPSQGVAGSAQSRRALTSDPFVQETMAYFSRLTIALVGIGAIEPSKLLADSGNVFTAEELAELKRQGAVGDVCLRFFDADGFPIVSRVDDRVIAITLEQLRRVPRVVAVAGGRRKQRALLGALRGRLIDVLITDRLTAQALADDGDAFPDTEDAHAA